MKHDQTRPADAGPSWFEVLLEVIGMVADFGFQIIACLLEGVSHF